MAHQGNSNKSQFFLAFRELSWCDGKHVVFGQVLHEDLPHLATLEVVGTRSGRPSKPIVVTDAGQLAGDGLNPTTAPAATRSHG